MARDITRTRNALFPGTCPGCQKDIEVGDKIARKENPRSGYKTRWKHASCETTWLCDGRMIPGSSGVPLYVGFNAAGERVGDNAENVLAGIATVAPSGTARMKARQGMVDHGLADSLDQIPF